MTDHQKKLREKYDELVNAIRNLLIAYDPISLIESGAPHSEYDPESAAIAAALRKCDSVDDVTRAVHAVLSEWFGPESAGPESKYQQLGAELWALETARRGHSES